MRTIPYATLGLLSCCLLHAHNAPAQSTPAAGIPAAGIPATAPTRSVSDLPSARPASGAVTARGDSQVTWDGAQLTIQAGGDDLRDILLKVARLSGMKITGGVPVERVFGSYGPGSAQKILTELMNGSGVNMMLINGSPVMPKELILTARAGGVTPPSTRSVSNADIQAAPTYPSYQPHNMAPPPGTPGVGGQPLPPDGGGNNSLNQDGGTPPATSTDGNSQPQSPNGTRTPEQIFEELRRRAQAAQQ